LKRERRVGKGKKGEKGGGKIPTSIIHLPSTLHSGKKRGLGEKEKEGKKRGKRGEERGATHSLCHPLYLRNAGNGGRGGKRKKKKQEGGWKRTGIFHTVLPRRGIGCEMLVKGIGRKKKKK